MSMRRSIVLTLIVILAGVAGFLLVNRDRVDAWVECTMQERHAPATAAMGDPFDSLAFEVVAPVEGAVAMDFHPTLGVMYVATKGGTVEMIEPSGSSVVLDIGSEVSSTLEQGLLGLAVAPAGDRIYLNYTDLEDHTHIIEYELAPATGRPVAETRREVLMVEQPFHTHNGGHLLFGPDGYLWIGLGDGGGSLKGPDFGFGENAQDLSSLHGSLLRIDPRPADGAAYTIPADNPYVGVEGARGEIWMTGLRNPWRFSFDSATGDLWIGDVGQFCWEEIDYFAAADGLGARANLGWPMVEGPDDYRGGSVDGVTWAIHDVSHSTGDRSVVGGVVYRGSEIPELEGWYVFTDTYVGNMRALQVGSGGDVEVRPLGVDRGQAVSFSEGPDGELYVLSFQEGVSKLVRATGSG